MAERHPLQPQSARAEKLELHPSSRQNPEHGLMFPSAMGNEL